ncbi:Ubiquitin-conjugating enzyme E2 C [Coemansia sp. RSA 2337]|nr:Ubiquitin-conjugating enzyme E2 C [Coemansia sp. S3946]KAJ2050265.1 Ubiquitin-conjugating enzyme E2 C [Coemansia sp. S16]KAJ2056862.1 Ubiquitin-conjugating enzyme E2 C [Coemansia sp. S2]KAJ2064751.1 Ubiquitin-conjugating enzyme E2 C [Coemansia sp. S155-1]KAJ2096333.1 Ubiquitin-conjugating enzyme E2 C [Coemansia sp. S142-1]KAJ2097480.1 Ubiquitin-conjugating enzyme E2 C [Coemansia sp. S100]KAJ2114678.1 Ubiquitin-conjugating enzyme E2 C [Coemansia sp. RSA 922]KAJ2352186.1 Ubiquitin-conjugati
MSAPLDAAVAKRLQSELMSLMMANLKGISAFPQSDNMLNWVGTLDGAPGTVYEGLTYKLALSFPSNYPFTAPTITFVTPCWHPNVDDRGNICLDILKEQWSAVYNVQTILLSLQTLLGDANPQSPLNGAAAQLWDNQAEYKRVLLKHYKEHAQV